MRKFEASGFDEKRLKEYGLYIKLIYDHEIYYYESDLEFTSRVIKKFNIDNRHQSNILYCIASISQDLHTGFHFDISHDDHSRKLETKKAKLVRDLQEATGETEPSFSTWRKIKRLEVTIGSRKIDATVLIDEVRQLLMAHWESGTYRKHTKPISERKAAIQRCDDFASFLLAEKIFRTKRSVYEFIQDLLEYSGFDFSKDSDPREQIKKGLIFNRIKS